MISYRFVNWWSFSQACYDPSLHLSLLINIRLTACVVLWCFCNAQQVSGCVSAEVAVEAMMERSSFSQANAPLLQRGNLKPPSGVLGADLRIYPEAGTPREPEKILQMAIQGGSCRADKQQRPQAHEMTSWSSCSGKAFLLCRVELPLSLQEPCVDLSTEITEQRLGHSGLTVTNENRSPSYISQFPPDKIWLYKLILFCL